MKRDKQEFSFKKLCSNLPNSTYIFAALFLAFVIFIPNFGSATNLSTLIGQAAILMVLSSAMSLAIITGGIDLSVGGLVSVNRVGRERGGCDSAGPADCGGVRFP